MSLASTLAQAIRPPVPPAVLGACRDGDRAVVENILYVALEIVPHMSIDLATCEASAGAYRLTVPLAGAVPVALSVEHILAISSRGDHKQAEAYIVQLCRCLHQVALDSGMWATGALLLPKPDPLFKQTTGGTEEELEAIIAYQEAMKRLKKTDGKFENGKDVKDIKKGE